MGLALMYGMTKEELELAIGNMSLVAAQKNKYENCKGGPSHHWWERQDRILDGYFEEFKRLCAIWVKRYGPLTVGQITEFENRWRLLSLSSLL